MRSSLLIAAAVGAATGRIVSLSNNRPLRGMTFPEFLPDGRSIILDQRSRTTPDEAIRVLTVK